MDLTDLKDILIILEKQDITEFELEQDGVKLRVCRSSPAAPAPVSAPHVPPADPVAVAPAADTVPAQVAAQTPASSGEEGTPAEAGTAIPSPIVGTFYRSPDPNSPPFVNVGDHVQVGQVLCIVEAMKLMNEIEAEVAGEILKIHPENGQPVQYGDTLFTVRPA